MRTIINIISLLFLFSTGVLAQSLITIEAPSPDPTLIVRGPEKEISSLNASDWETKGDGLYLFTSGYGKSVKSSKSNYVGIVVDSQFKVLEILNGGVTKGQRPSFNQSLDLNIPENGFVLVASDDSYATKGFKKFVAESFRKGDLVKLRNNGEIADLQKVFDLLGRDATPILILEDDILKTVRKSKEVIKGSIANFSDTRKLSLTAKSGNVFYPVKCDRKGNISATISLMPGTNYIDFYLLENGIEIQKVPMAIYYKTVKNERSEIVMWVEQFPNATTLTTDEAVEEMVQNGKKAGFTSLGFDVKGPEGYVSYRKNNLSKSPYLTNSINPKKKVEENGFDLLESILKYAHKHNMKVYTSFNFFTEGNITAGDYAILDQYKDWEEIVQRPEDKGKILRVRDSQHGKDASAGKKIALAFVNPSNQEVQDFQLKRVEEVLQNYPIDGIVLDRCRYDNLYADFSPVTRNAFAHYLNLKGEKLENFPNDAFLIDENGLLIKGKYYKDWINFRSLTIKQFTDRVRSLIDQYKISVNPDLKLAAYVGSWYEVYYQNGVNWASNDFSYESRLNFPESEIYNAEYNKSSYLENLDFLMIGTYYKTGKEVNRYITLGNILTNGKLPLIGSMSLPDLKPEEQSEVFKASLDNSSGLMIFDHCYIKWQEFINNMKDAMKNRDNN